MNCQTVNLEAGMPTVEAARARLSQALRVARANRVRVVKLVHGYGSSGTGGRMKADVQKVLAGKKQAGEIREYVKGEDFSAFSPEARRILDACPEMSRDADYARANHGITVVLL
ncbi:MAG: Smr/MutS family protein [Oscillospiraceae bacterium]|nr:Smr/MutS family protein [Oscillospiraceae bacterium]